MTHDPLIGRRLANFRIERVLGRGGMAHVYYGRDVSLQRPVAVKVIDASYRGNPNYAKRFIQEARTIATWRHENIIQIYYADNEGDLFYYAMEYVDGLDLSELLQQYAADGELMPHEDVIRIGKAVAQALDYAHNKGVIHRDIKPSNIMIATDERVILMDFGLAMDVAQGTIGEVFGSPHYISPEQARTSADAVPQSDLYSLGVVLYEMLTGSVPFDDPAPTAVALQHLTLDPPAPRELNANLNVATEQVLLKALSKDPADRYESGHDLIAALQRALDALPDENFEMAGLPPLPAGMPPLSRNTVQDRLALYTRSTTTAPSYPEVNLASTERHGPVDPIQSPHLPVDHLPTYTRPRHRPGLWILGAVAAVAMIVLVIIGVLLLVRNRDTASPEDNQQSMVDIDATATTDAFLQSATVDPSVTPTPIPASIEASISAQENTDPTLEPTLMPTETAAPPTSAPTNTLEAPTLMPASPTTIAVQSEPTILYPSGRRMVLFYNPHSFYIYNASGQSTVVSPFGFERVLSNGSYANRFDGTILSALYGRIDSNWCASVELLERTTSQFVRPDECGRRYNIQSTPRDTYSYIFWTPSADSEQFRVLWDNEEVGRCEIAASQCEVFLP